jgi:hypothetical protein
LWQRDVEGSRVRAEIDIWVTHGAVPATEVAKARSLVVVVKLHTDNAAF